MYTASEVYSGISQLQVRISGKELSLESTMQNITTVFAFEFSLVIVIFMMRLEQPTLSKYSSTINSEKQKNDAELPWASTSIIFDMPMLSEPAHDDSEIRGTLQTEPTSAFTAYHDWHFELGIRVLKWLSRWAWCSVLIRPESSELDVGGGGHRVATTDSGRRQCAALSHRPPSAETITSERLASAILNLKLNFNVQVTSNTECPSLHADLSL